MIDYLIVVPDENCSKDRGHKYPFLANQLFSDGGDGVTEVIEKFFYSYSVTNTKAVRDDVKNETNIQDSGKNQN